MKNIKTQITENYTFKKMSRFFKVAFLIALLPLTLMFLSLIPQKNNKVPDKKNGNNIKYAHFLYLTKETPLKITTFSNDSVCNISVYNHYLESVEITDIIPKPYKVISNNGTKTFTFLLSGSGDQQFIFKTKPTREGNISGVISIDNKIFNFNQFIYTDRKLFN